MQISVLRLDVFVSISGLSIAEMRDSRCPQLPPRRSFTMADLVSNSSSLKTGLGMRGQAALSDGIIPGSGFGTLWLRHW